MATGKKTTKKTGTRKTPVTPNLFKRLVKRAAAYRAKRPHHSFRRTRWPRRQRGGQPVAPVSQLVIGSFRTIWQERKIVLGLALLYAVVNFLLLGAISQADFVDLKDTVVQVMQGDIGAIGNAMALFTSTLSGLLNQPLDDLQQFLGYFLGFLLWLALVWALRMRLANEKIKIRDVLYNSSSPLLSTLVVASVVIVQLLPGAIGVALLVMAQQLGVLQSGVEYILFGTAGLLFGVLSLYWVVSSLMAMVVVTLPGMYPWQALSNASVLVIGQRWKIMVRIVVLAVMYGLLWAVVLIPALLLDGWLRVDWLPIVPVTVQALAAFTLTYFAVYVYKMYRSLL